MLWLLRPGLVSKQGLTLFHSRRANSSSVCWACRTPHDHTATPTHPIPWLSSSCRAIPGTRTRAPATQVRAGLECGAEVAHSLLARGSQPRLLYQSVLCTVLLQTVGLCTVLLQTVAMPLLCAPLCPSCRQPEPWRGELSMCFEMSHGRSSCRFDMTFQSARFTPCALLTLLLVISTLRRGTPGTRTRALATLETATAAW